MVDVIMSERKAILGHGVDFTEHVTQIDICDFTHLIIYRKQEESIA